MIMEGAAWSGSPLEPAITVQLLSMRTEKRLKEEPDPEIKHEVLETDNRRKNHLLEIKA